MSSLPATASLQEIENEIAYTQTLIGAIDETSDSYVEGLMELDMTLRDLERRYREKRMEEAGIRNDDDHEDEDDDDDDDEVMRILKGTSVSSTSRPLDTWAEHPTSASGNGDGVWNSSTTGLEDWGFDDLDTLYPTSSTGVQVNQESLPSTSSPQKTSGGSSPSSVPLPSRKRPRESLAVTNNRGGPPDAKAMRYTPSPAVTAPTTPSSLESFELPDDPEFIRLTGGNPRGDMEEFRQSQREMLEQIEQERKSAELAKKLSEEESFRRRLYQQPSSQATLSFDGKGFRPIVAPPARGHPLASSSSHDYLQDKHNTQPGRTAPMPHIKPEWSQGANANTPFQNVPGSFIDLGSDSSDLEEIQAKDFRASCRKSQTPADNIWPGNTPDYARMPVSNGFASKASWPEIEQLDASTPWLNTLQDTQNHFSMYPDTSHSSLTGYGVPSVYDTDSTASQLQRSWLSGVAGMVGQGFMNAAQGAKNAAYSLLDGEISTYPGAVTGYGGTGLPGSSTNPHTVGSASGMDLYGSKELDQPYRKESHPNYWDRYDYLTNDPTRTREEIKSLLENIRPDEELPENREGDPEAMKYPLMPHQKLGLTWMKNMEEGSNKGGILADDMGLGKTIQALALMVSRRSPDPSRKTNLIVAPVALLKQWEREIQKKLKSGHHALTTYILHGSKRDTTFAELKKYDVVLTTFGTLANEIKRKEALDQKRRTDKDWRPSGKAHKLPLLGDECKWYR